VGLQSFEDGLGRMVEGVFSRAFKSNVRPIEIGRRLIKEIDSNRTVDMKGRRVVPNQFVVRLAADDQAALADIESALITELAEAVKEYCADENYHLRGPVVVTIEIDQSVNTGRIEVDSSVRKVGASEIVAKVTLPDDRKITLGKDTLIIGRLAECDIAFDDSNVSRRHAEIKAVADGFAVNDLGSTNGTKVNGVTITFERALRDGDIISVGSHSIRYEAK
jgi:hypothetical protein